LGGKVGKGGGGVKKESQEWTPFNLKGIFFCFWCGSG
jgi:hypothetical protein